MINATGRDRRVLDRVFSNVPTLNLPVLANTGVESKFSIPKGLFLARFVTTAQITLLTAAATGAEAGGFALNDVTNGQLPAAYYDVIAARIRGTLSLSAGTATTTAGEIGIGHAAGAGDNAVLGTTSNDQSFVEGVTLGNIVAAGTLDIDVRAPAANIGRQVDLTAGAGDLYLNYATTIGVAATSALLAAGAIIELWMLGLEA